MATPKKKVGKLKFALNFDPTKMKPGAHIDAKKAINKAKQKSGKSQSMSMTYHGRPVITQKRKRRTRSKPLDDLLTEIMDDEKQQNNFYNVINTNNNNDISISELHSSDIIKKEEENNKSNDIQIIDDKWDYDIKISDNENDNNDNNDNDNTLATLIDEKYKNSKSLVDVLMDGPQAIYNDNNDNNDNNVVIVDRWDYDIKISDDDKSDGHNSSQNDTDNVLSNVLDKKYPNYKSLVDVLMDGPQTIYNDDNDEKQKQKQKPKVVATDVVVDRWDYNIKLSDNDDDDDDNNKDDNDDNTLSRIIDKKYKNYSSLVDVLMDGPQGIHNKKEEEKEYKNKTVAQNILNDNDYQQTTPQMDRSDYSLSIAFSDQDTDNEQDDDNDKNADVLSTMIDAKYKNSNSLVDILIDGPQGIYDKNVAKQIEFDKQIKSYIKIFIKSYIHRL